MAVDYEKLLNLDYTAYEHSQDFQKGLEKRGLENPSIEVEKDYHKGVPEVVVNAKDQVKDITYIDTYHLEDVTEEEFEEVMFETWETAMKELEN